MDRAMDEKQKEIQFNYFFLLLRLKEEQEKVYPSFYSQGNNLLGSIIHLLKMLKYQSTKYSSKTGKCVYI